ncbi:MAG: ABC transporter permease [Euryarchaeota archaeon]|nr:ABC transporter permease [Euryarchaeota archaeon]MDE1835168.1 ABC transporter permease [Euryarchaeota archaeon]MDE1880421.1 ABC transporter permease [Euryarchaeota archaeon]MDE2045710.1 ABC transporter permease [Thermoplasmata archaeon]
MTVVRSVVGPRVFLASLRITVLQFLADPQWIIGSAAAPVVFALTAFEIYRFSSPTLVLFSILGGGMMSMWAQTLYGSGWATSQDRFLGTLEPTLGAPVGYVWVVAGRVVWNTISGLLGGALVFGVVALAYGRPLPVKDPALFAVLFVVVMLALSTVGLLFTALFVFSRYAGFVQNIGEFTFYVITGCMFPILILPFWTLPFSLAFPATWALEALRAATFPSYGGLSWGVAGDLVGTLALSLAYVVASWGLYRWVVRYLSDKGGGTADDY